MAELYQDIPELGAKERAILRRQRIAESLQAQSQQPLETNQMAGGYVVPVSPLSAIAKLVQAYSGAKTSNNLDAEYGKLATDRQQMVADELAKYQATANGTPAVEMQGAPGIPSQNAQDAVAPTPYAPAQPEVKGDPRAAVTQAMLSQLPEMQRVGALELNNLNRKEDRTQAHQDKLYEIDANAQNRLDALQLQLQENRITKEEALKQAKAIADQASEDRRFIAGQASADRRFAASQTNSNAPLESVIIDGKPVLVPRNQAAGMTPAGAPQTKADTKLAASMPKEKARVSSMTQNFDRLDEALTELDADPGLSHITGTIAGRTPNVTNAATGAQAKLNSIKSQIFVSALQSMREASKTGGAVGNVSDREGDKLENTLAALDQAQGTPDFRKQLKKAQEQVRLSKQIIQNTFDDTYANVMPDTPAAPAKPAGGAVLKFDAQGNPI